jgi:hypothetical protein
MSPRESRQRRRSRQAHLECCVLAERTAPGDSGTPGGRRKVGQFAYRLPVTVIAELLGVPSSDRDLFHRWADHLLSMPRTDIRSEGFAARVVDALREMDEYLLRHCRARLQRQVMTSSAPSSLPASGWMTRRSSTSPVSCWWRDTSPRPCCSATPCSASRRTRAPPPCSARIGP